MRILTALLMLCLCAFTAFADDNACGLGKLPDVFTGCKMQDGVIHLNAGDKYLKQKKGERALELEPVLASAKSVLAKNTLSVDYTGGGELWSLDEKGRASALDTWSDMNLNVNSKIQTRGRIFGYIGGQLMRGGDYPSKGFTARLGTTLFQGRYDASVSYSHNSFDDIDNSGSNSVGLAGRALFRYTKKIGLNIGGQINRVSYNGYSDWSPGLMGGVNIYTPTGSVDVTLNYGEYGSKSLQLGYTVFISKR